MNVEKSIQFILEQQTKTAALLFASEKRAERHEKRMDRQEKRLGAVEHTLKAIARIIRESEEDHRRAHQEMGYKLKEMGYKLNALIDAQMRAETRLDKVEARQAKTDEKFERFIAILARQHGNGGNRK